MQNTLITELINSFKVLPGVGAKSAQRMAYHLLERNREGGKQLAETLIKAVEEVKNCSQCRDLTDQEICSICSSPSRHRNQLCVVESPVDVMAIEQSGIYKGLYFVLMGHLSPIDGIGPEQLGLDLLKQRLQTGEVEELILATNPTVEGEATAHYIQQMAHAHAVSVSRPAQGIPLGGELEYVDTGTLTQAFAARTQLMIDD